MAEDMTLSEEARTEGWRAEEFSRLGFDQATAWELALDPDADLALARKIIKQGCPIDIAARILA